MKNIALAILSVGMMYIGLKTIFEAHNKFHDELDAASFALNH